MEYEQVEVNSERWFDLTPLLNEEFRDIEETYNKYQVSNYGRIKSKKNNTILSVKNSKGWYLTISFYIDGKRITLRPHRLVGKYFIPNPENKKCINHIDLNKQNNRVDNLEYCTHKENMQHAIKNGHFYFVGYDNKNRVYKHRTGNKMKINKCYGKIYQFSLDMNYINTYNNSTQASRETGVCSRNILHCINHQEGRKQAGGFIWLCESEVVSRGIKI